MLNPNSNDTDGDGLADGLEIGLTMPSVGTDPLKFRPDWNSYEHTDPKDADSDDDGLSDSQEDRNRNGASDGDETDPRIFDSDYDGLPDGKVNFGGTWKGEDLNLNGVRDQDADWNWTESDPLASDSDVDGIADGQEVNGSWCYSTQVGCVAGVGLDASRVTFPLNPDTDTDGLRDGQETAGWKVATWREVSVDPDASWSFAKSPR